MGKAYASELERLEATYQWAQGADIEPLQAFVAEAQGKSLLAVGSGGSMTAAHLSALVHRHGGGSGARHVTPLEMLLSEPAVRYANPLLLSASGRNRDVLAALEYCIHSEVRALAVVCTRPGSPLANAARRFERAYVLDERSPSGKDGFLATNSLLATCVLVARAYAANLSEHPAGKLSADVASAFGRPNFQILHGGWGSPVATDLESKLNESAMAAAQVSDYRNFGHGRHLWVARRGAETAIIALVTPETAQLAERTCALLPGEVPVLRLTTDREGPGGTIDLLIQGFRLVGALGALQEFDPGCPAVPEFGRKMYHLAPPPPLTHTPAPVTRKVSRALFAARDDQTAATAALSLFTEKLESECFSALVLDYDGTLCTRSDRYGALRSDIATECRRLVRAGLVLGIATGRGRSARDALRKAMLRSHWPQIVVGYYNGAEIASLDEDLAPRRDGPAEAPLDACQSLLESDRSLRAIGKLTVRPRQITIELTRHVCPDILMSYVMNLLGPVEHLGVRVLASSHSVDVIPSAVGKLAVVDHVARQVGDTAKILCIGDRGAWPGNDSALLTHEPSLSVDEVSASLRTCWNLAPPGVDGPTATLLYLRALRAKGVDSRQSRSAISGGAGR